MANDYDATITVSLYGYNRTTGTFYNRSWVGYNSYIDKAGELHVRSNRKSSSFTYNLQFDLNITENGCSWSNFKLSHENSLPYTSWYGNSVSTTEARFVGVAYPSSTYKATTANYRPNYGTLHISRSCTASRYSPSNSTKIVAIFANDWDIIKNLTSTKLENTATFVPYNNSYTTKVLPTNSNYELDKSSVVVKMNNVDITQTVFNSNTSTISIPQVTGTLNITAKSKKIKKYFLKINGSNEYSVDLGPKNSARYFNYKGTNYLLLNSTQLKTFYVYNYSDGNSYSFSFINGMTFGNFYYSEYNTDNRFSINNNYIYFDGYNLASTDTEISSTTYYIESIPSPYPHQEPYPYQEP